MSKSSLLSYTAMCFDNKSVIYNSYMDDTKRGVLTRWRLSNHQLKIELGRYQKPIIPRDQRICDLCEELEDGAHVVFKCPIYNNIRDNYKSLLEKKMTLKNFGTHPLSMLWKQQISY